MTMMKGVTLHVVLPMDLGRFTSKKWGELVVDNFSHGGLRT